MWQLLVHSDSDVRDEVAKAVLAALGRAHTRRVEASNLAKAKEALDEHDMRDCNLVVLGTRTPQDKTSNPWAGGNDPSLPFIKWLKGQSARLPILVLSPTPDDALNMFLSTFDSTALVAFDGDWRDVLQERLPDLVNGTVRPDAGCLELDITLAGARRTSWRLQQRGDDPFEDFGELYVEDTALKSLLHRSEELQERVTRKGWEVEMSEIGSGLFDLLFLKSEPNRRLFNKFVKRRERVGGLPKTRVRITLNDDTHPMFVEALKDIDDPAFWMLNAPVFRRHDSAGARYPLFKDGASREGPINCLVITADPQAGNIPDGEWTHGFAPLGEIEDEAKDIVAILEKARGAHGEGRVKHLSLADVDTNPVDKVNKILSECPWHLVHFAGHGMISAGGDAGLVLAPERGGVIRIADLASKLVGTQFLFLNSCRSADSYFVTKAVEHLVPAVLGFRWSVSDVGGANFAREFYKALFDPAVNRYLEYAFMRARKAIHKKNPGDPTWASPVLVMQLDRAQ
jgi:hypothetical protein